MRVIRIPILILAAGVGLVRGLAAAPAAPTPAASVAPPVVAVPTEVMHVDARPALAAAAARPPATPSETLFKAAVWPGILWHGAGYAEAGDNDMELGLSGMEGFSLFVVGFAGYELAFVPAKNGENKDTSTALTLGGAALFLTGWTWDMIGSYLEVKRRGPAPNISLSPLPNGAALAYRF